MRNLLFLFIFSVLAFLTCAIAAKISSIERPYQFVKSSYWSGDDTLKVMIVDDSAYIIKKK